MNKTAFACRNCGQRLEESDAFCQHCGQAVPDARGAGRAGNENYLALVRADVYRLRRQWHLAEVECSEVVRRDPENPDAYSVMGDIYRDQGKLRDAIEWYRMALERNPASVADRRKLETLIDKVFGGTRERPARRGLLSALSGRLGAGESVSVPHPCSLTATVALALAVVFAIAISTALLGHRAGEAPAGSTPPTASGAFAPAPEGAASGRQAVSGQGTGREVREDVAEVLVSLENELLERLQIQAGSVDVNCEVTSVEIDPRQSAASIRFTMPRLWSPAEARRNIARVAGALAAETLAWDERIGSVKARCDLRGAEGQAQLVMLAEANRETVREASGDAPSGHEDMFGFIWWHPELRRAPDVGGSGPEG